MTDKKYPPEKCIICGAKIQATEKKDGVYYICPTKDCTYIIRYVYEYYKSEVAE